MGNEKFTKWEWERAKNFSRNGTGSIRGLSLCRIVDKNRVAVAYTVPKASQQEQIANTNLIAAAPEMYYCICDALTDLEMSEGMRKYFETVLKKARGEE